MKLLSERRAWLIPAGILVLAGLIFAVSGALFFSSSLADSAKFLAFLIIFILPGIAAVKMTGIGKTPLVSLVLAFALSLGLMFLLYLGLSAAGLGSMLFLVLPVMGAAGLLGIVRFFKKPFSKEPDRGELGLALILCAAALFLTVLTVTAGNLNPALTGPRQYHVDLLNSVGLVDSAYRGFRFSDVKADGIPYDYHALGFAFLAVMKSVTVFSNFDLITKYSVSVFTPFAAAAILSLVHRISRRNIYIVIAFIALFILRPFENSFLYYMYGDTLGFSLAVGLAAVTALLFIEAAKDAAALSLRYAAACFTLALTAAAKGPIAAVCLVGFGFSILLRMIKGKKILRGIVRGTVMLAAFFAAYFVIYGTETASLVEWYPGRFVRDTKMFGIVAGIFGKESAGLTIAAAQIVTYCFMTAGVVLSVIIIVLRFKSDNEFFEFTASASLAGMLLMNLTHQYGGSEIYFGLAGYPFAAAALTVFLPSFRFKNKKTLRASAILVFALFLAGVSVSSAPAVSFFAEAVSAAGRYASGSPARVDDEYKLKALDSKRFDYITDKEYEAMLWLRDNTPKDAVIVTDSILLHNKYMYGSAFSERVFYLEGYVYITSYDETSRYYAEIEHRIKTLEDLYADDPGALTEVRNTGADYLTVSSWQHPDARFDLEKVFENRDVTIYKL